MQQVRLFVVTGYRNLSTIDRLRVKPSRFHLGLGGRLRRSAASAARSPASGAAGRKSILTALMTSTAAVSVSVSLSAETPATWTQLQVRGRGVGAPGTSGMMVEGV
jgi:hypothetical protein